LNASTTVITTKFCEQQEYNRNHAVATQRTNQSLSSSIESRVMVRFSGGGDGGG
jgi:hypothetical protein